jgi:hypothetical protein
LATEQLSITEAVPQKQAPSAAVTQAIRRAQESSLLDIKRGSLWTIAMTARGWLDGILWTLEEERYDEVHDTGKEFVEHARAVVKLLNDFERSRQAIAQQWGTRQ